MLPVNLDFPSSWFFVFGHFSAIDFTVFVIFSISAKEVEREISMSLRAPRKDQLSSSLVRLSSASCTNNTHPAGNCLEHPVHHSPSKNPKRRATTSEHTLRSRKVLCLFESPHATMCVPYTVLQEFVSRPVSRMSGDFGPHKPGPGRSFSGRPVRQ